MNRISDPEVPLFASIKHIIFFYKSRHLKFLTLEKAKLRRQNETSISS